MLQNETTNMFLWLFIAGLYALQCSVWNVECRLSVFRARFPSSTTQVLENRPDSGDSIISKVKIFPSQTCLHLLQMTLLFSTEEWAKHSLKISPAQPPPNFCRFCPVCLLQGYLSSMSPSWMAKALGSWSSWNARAADDFVQCLVCWGEQRIPVDQRPM